MLAATPQRQAAGLKAKLFRGFADTSRLAIIEALLEGPCSVTEIVETTGLSQSNVSNHLRCLAGCGLVVDERDGRYVHYQLSDPRVAQLIGPGGGTPGRRGPRCLRLHALQ